MGEIGKTIGKIAGGALGTLVAPGAGTVVGEQLGGALGGSIGGKSSGTNPSFQSSPGSAGTASSLAIGALQSLQAANLKRKADAAMPELIDPNQSSYLAELNQKRRSIETGSAFAGAGRAADMGQAEASNNIINSSGGDTGSTLQGLLQSQAVAGDVKNKALAQGQSNQLAYDNSYGNMLSQVSARALQLKLLKSQQERAEWAQKQQSANQNINAGVGRLLSGMGGDKISQSSVPMGTTGSSALSQLSPNLNNDIPETGMPNVVPQKTLTIQALGPQL